MIIMVVGLGSMGKRRIRLLQVYSNRACKLDIIGVDSNEERCKNVGQEYMIPTFISITDAIQNKQVECAVVSTSPNTHADIIRECLQDNLHVFTELNLISKGYEENISLADSKNRILFLSSTFLYRKEIEYIKEAVSRESFKGSYRYHVGQYLPLWHPWENYKDFFVKKKETNACRELLAVELPWIVDVFGDITRIYTLKKKISTLDIDYDDCYQILIEHNSGTIGNLCVDVVTPKTDRNFEVWSERFYVGWNGTPDTLIWYNECHEKFENVNLYKNIEQQEGYNKFIIENAYYDEIVNFINCIEKKERPRYSFEQDMKIIQYIDQVEREV